MRFSLPPQYSRLLLGVVLGFILGTVLYQSQRREFVFSLKGQVAPLNDCQESAVNGSCPSGGYFDGTNCYVPDTIPAHPCTRNGLSGICYAGACIVPSSSSFSSSCGATYPVSCTGLLGQFCCPVGNECVDTNADGYPEICGPAQCAALGTACGTEVEIPCNDTDPNDPMQPTPTCPSTSSTILNYCVSNTICHYKKNISCCAGSTCDSNTNTCVDKPDYCCNTSNYMCYPSSSSSSSSSCSITVGNGGCRIDADCCSTSARPLFCDFGANSSASTGYCNDRPSSSSSSSSCKGGGVTCAEDGECCSDYCNSTNNFTCDYTSPAPCESGQTSRQNANGSILCCTPPSAPVDTDGDGNYECAGSPPTTPPPATTNPTTTNPTVANPAVADPTTVCPAGQCCPACGADFTCITLVQGSPTCIPNDYLSSTSSSSSQCTFGSCGTSADCCGNNVCQNGSCVNQSCNSPTISCGDRCCLPSEACFIQGNSARCETISSSSSSCMSTGQYCGMSCDRCCSGNGTLFFCS